MSVENATVVRKAVGSCALRVGLSMIAGVCHASKSQLELSCDLSGVAGHASLATSLPGKTRSSRRSAELISKACHRNKSGMARERHCSCSFCHSGRQHSSHGRSLCPGMLTSRTFSAPCTAASVCSLMKPERRRITCGSAASAPKLNTASVCCAEC